MQKLCALLTLSIVLGSAVIFTPVGHAQEQTNPTLTSEGVSNDIDTKHRSPIVSVTPVLSGTGTKLLVDAYTQAPEYKHLPIRFDFYINRHFYTSQLRSSELPGPVGIDVGIDRAPRPFNYSIVAVLLHPNREFTTVLHGAVFDSTLTSTLDCTLTTGVNTENSIEYVANDVQTSQSGNSSFSISFEESSVSDGHEIVFNATVVVNGETATGDFKFTQDEGTETTADAEGEVALTEEDELDSLSLTSSDGNITLNCS